jgi:DNA-binding NarL/FixJ family response regulator
MNPTTKPPTKGAKPMNTKTETRPIKQAMPQQAPIGRADGEVTLTLRQRQVAELVAKGLSNARIAATLGITKATVRWELRAIHRRTGRPLRLVRAAVLPVGLALSSPAAGAVVDVETETDGVAQFALSGGGLASSFNKRGNATQSTTKTGSVKAIPRSETTKGPLSPRVLQVLNLAAQGRLHKEIAEELGISCNTVKAHMHNLRLRLGVAGSIKDAIHQF